MISKSKKIIAIITSVAVVSGAGFFGYKGLNKHRYQKSMKLGASYMKEGNYDKAAEEFETASKINVKEDKTEANNNLQIANVCKEADDYCQSGDYKKALETVKKLEITDVADEVKSGIDNINSKIDENLTTEKAEYAKLLRDKNWLNENAEYNTAKDTIRFLPLDLENDGTLDLLVFHEGKGGMAGITLSVITYDRINDSISRKDINTSHGGYVGYIEDSKTIVTNYMQMGITGEIGYTLQDGEYKKTFITFDNSGSMISGVPTYKIDEKQVSEDEYKSYVEDYQSKLTNKEMYELTEENIKNTLENDEEPKADDSDSDSGENAQEKAEYAKLLRDKTYLTEDLKYNDAAESMKFLTLDLGKDGILDLLLYHESTYAGTDTKIRTLHVLTYDKASNKVNKKDIEIGVADYQGYLGDTNTILTMMNSSGMIAYKGYTLQNGEYAISLSTSDDSGCLDPGATPLYFINNESVSVDKYKSYVEDMKSKIENKDLYELTEENIKNILGGSADSSDTSSEVSETNSAQNNSSSDKAKVRSKEEAIQLIKQVDCNRVAESKLTVFSFVGMRKGVDGYTFPEDEYYMFNADAKGTPVEAQGMGAKYLVGKNTAKVYSTANQGGYNIYLIDDNKIIETLKDESVPESSDWRTK